MKIYLLKKEKGKKYESKAICEKALDFDLQYDGKKPLGCSISDTQGFWACAIGDCGLDIEESTRRPKENVVKALHKREQDYLNGLNYGNSEWFMEFLRIWTTKEAIYKVFGRSFKEMPILDENLEYIGDFDGYLVNNFEYKGLIGCLIAKEDFEIVPIKYAGKTAKDVLSYAGDLLAIRSYSKADLGKKLKTKGYNEGEIEEALSKLEELGYVDDGDYAQRFAENAVLAGKGNGYIKQKLILSGIASELIPQPEDEYERAISLLPSMEGKKPEQIGRRLASLGFSPSTVYKVLSKIR